MAHDLGYLVKYMRSGAEVKRIQTERQLLKDYEKAEEQRRIAFIKANEGEYYTDTCIMQCRMICSYFL